MAMGKRRQRQEALFIMADGLPQSAGHPFYQRLNALLAEANFDHWIEGRCQRVLRTRRTARAAFYSAGGLLPHALGGLLRRDR